MARVNKKDRIKMSAKKGRSCVHKVRFKDDQDAKRSATTIKYRHDTVLRPYHCEYCNGYHLSSKE